KQGSVILRWYRIRSAGKESCSARRFDNSVCFVAGSAQEKASGRDILGSSIFVPPLARFSYKPVKGHTTACACKPDIALCFRTVGTITGFGLIGSNGRFFHLRIGKPPSRKMPERFL